MICRGKGQSGNSDTLMRYRMAGFASLAVLIFGIASPQTFARDAAFLDPGAGSSAGTGDDAVKVEPKGDIDIGNSVLNVSRHANLFFVNQSGGPVKVEKVTVNGDGNVANEIVTDDCSKQGTIPPGSRCSVEISLTPSSPGPWTAEVLLTHDGAGRIARAKLTGKTTGVITGEKKDMGLALNTKESTPVSFGDVDVDSGKVVRSALMVNDSAEPITLYSIDVIEASNGLQRLDQGCAVDMELKPGESCPVTLVWTPSNPGQISTDLIIRHSGRLGFAVIPIRGVAKGEGNGGGKSASDTVEASTSKGGIPSPPGAVDIEKAMNGKIPAVSDKDLGGSTGKSSSSSSTSASVGTFYLIGTVGNRAVILKPDGKTVIVNAGDDMDVGEKSVKVVLVTAKSVDLLMEGKKKTISLSSSPDIIEKASLVGKKNAKNKDKDADSDTASTASTSSAAPTTSGAAK